MAVLQPEQHSAAAVDLLEVVLVAHHVKDLAFPIFVTGYGFRRFGARQNDVTLQDVEFSLWPLEVLHQGFELMTVVSDGLYLRETHR